MKRNSWSRLNWDFKSEGRNENMVYVNRRKVLIMFKMLKSRLHVGWEFQNRNMNLSFYCFVFIFKRTLVSTFIFSVRNMFNQELEQKCRLEVLFLKHLCSSSQAQALSISWGKENFSLMTKKILWRASRVSREFFKANTSIQPIRKENFEWYFS